MQLSTTVNNINWRVIPSNQIQEKGLDNVHTSHVLEKIQEFSTTLKDDKRSLVKQGFLFDTQVIAKQPRDKNRRLWMKILSFFRHSEALSAQHTLTQFSQKGIESVKPICVLEHRKWGFLTDSWIIYEFREGYESSVEHLPQIIELLQKLHRNGYRHDDPNFGNFLVKQQDKTADTSNEELFLIDCKGKKRLGLFSDYYDFMLLSQRNEGVSMEKLIDKANINTNLLGYKLAEFYAAYKRKRTEFKEKRRARRKTKK